MSENKISNSIKKLDKIVRYKLIPSYVDLSSNSLKELWYTENDYKKFVSKKNKKNYDYEYLYFILFSWDVLDNETEKAINWYYKIRKHNPELTEIEADIFNLLPIENIEGLKESIK